MSTESGAPAASAAPASMPDEISLEDARHMIDAMPDGAEFASGDDNSPAESAEPATAEPESPKVEDADPERDPGEDQEEADPEEKLPPIDPPRSWTQAEKERFQSLPRETQEYLHTREQEREREFRRSQNEIADQRKAVQAERESAEKARQQYEAQLPTLMRSLEEAYQASFSDVKTMEDVVKLQADDPFRFQAWQVHQMKLQAAKVESDRVSRENETAEQSKWAQYVKEETSKAIEFIPELADKAKGEALSRRVASELLPELGFKDGELNDLASGKAKLSIYDHRVQRLLADAVKLRDIQSAPKAVAKPNLPPVQKPGVPRGNSADANIQSLAKRLEQTGSEADGFALIMALEKASSRRAS